MCGRGKRIGLIGEPRESLETTGIVSNTLLGRSKCVKRLISSIWLAFQKDSFFSHVTHKLWGTLW